MRFHHAIFLASVCAFGCSDGSDPQPDRNTKPEHDVSGLWRFSWQTDGKDNADILTVQLEQTGSDVSGRGCSLKYQDQGGTHYLQDATCEKETYTGELRDPALELSRAADELWARTFSWASPATHESSWTLL